MKKRGKRGSVVFDDDNKFNEVDSFFYINSCIYIFMIILSLNHNQLGRLAYYFSLGNIITVANAVMAYKKRDGKRGLIMEIMIIVFSSLYFFVSTPGGTLQIDNYNFFWND